MTDQNTAPQPPEQKEREVKVKIDFLTAEALRNTADWEIQERDEKRSGLGHLFSGGENVMVDEVNSSIGKLLLELQEKYYPLDLNVFGDEKTRLEAAQGVIDGLTTIGTTQRASIKQRIAADLMNLTIGVYRQQPQELITKFTQEIINAGVDVKDNPQKIAQAIIEAKIAADDKTLASVKSRQAVTYITKFRARFEEKQDLWSEFKPPLTQQGIIEIFGEEDKKDTTKAKKGCIDKYIRDPMRNATFNSFILYDATGEVKIEFKFHLEHVLGLVCAATQDLNALTGHGSGKSAQELSDRLQVTLLQRLQELNEDPRCGEGFRNRMTQVLEGTYPGVGVIYDPTATLGLEASNFYGAKLQALEQQGSGAAFTLYRAWMLGEVQSSAGEALSKFFKDHEKELEEFLKKKYYPLIGRAATDGAIKNILAKRDNRALRPPPNIDPNANYVRDLFTVAYDTNDQRTMALQYARDRVSEFKTFADLKLLGLSNLIAEEQLYRAAQRYNEFVTLHPEAKLSQTIKEIRRHTNGFFSGFVADVKACEVLAKGQSQDAKGLQEQERKIAGVQTELKRLQEIFEKQIQEKETDDFIINSFARYFGAFSANLLHERFVLSRDLVRLQDKIVPITDSEIEAMFRPEQSEAESKTTVTIVLTPLVVNRIFWHALLVSPESWSGTFAERFRTTLQFIAKELSSTQQNNSLLKKSSYPEVLLLQLNARLAIYDYFKTQASVETKSDAKAEEAFFKTIKETPIVVPAICSVGCTGTKPAYDHARLANNMWNMQDEKTWCSCFDAKAEAVAIKNQTAFWYSLPLNLQQELHRKLGTTGTSGAIPQAFVNGDGLLTYLNSLPEDQEHKLSKDEVRLNALKLFGPDRVLATIQLGESKVHILDKYLSCFNDKISFLRQIISSSRELAIVLKNLAAKDWENLSDCIDVKYIQSLIVSLDKLVEVMLPIADSVRQMLSPQELHIMQEMQEMQDTSQESQLVTILRLQWQDADKLQAILRLRDLVAILRLNFLRKFIGAEQLRGLINSYADFEQLLSLLTNEKTKLYFITLLGVNKVRALIPSAEKLAEILKRNFSNVITIGCILRFPGADYWQNIITSYSDWEKISSELSCLTYEDLLQLLGAAKIRAIINTTGQLIAIYDNNIRPPSKLQFLRLLGREKLQTLVSNYVDFVEIKRWLGRRPERYDFLNDDDVTAYLELLGVEKVATIITNGDALVYTLAYLKNTDKIQLLRLLGVNRLQEYIHSPEVFVSLLRGIGAKNYQSFVEIFTATEICSILKSVTQKQKRRLPLEVDHLDYKSDDPLLRQLISHISPEVFFGAFSPDDLLTAINQSDDQCSYLYYILRKLENPFDRFKLIRELVTKQENLFSMIANRSGDVFNLVAILPWEDDFDISKFLPNDWREQVLNAAVHSNYLTLPCSNSNAFIRAFGKWNFAQLIDKYKGHTTFTDRLNDYLNQYIATEPSSGKRRIVRFLVYTLISIAVTVGIWFLMPTIFLGLFYSSITILAISFAALIAHEIIDNYSLFCHKYPRLVKGILAVSVIMLAVFSIVMLLTQHAQLGGALGVAVNITALTAFIGVALLISIWNFNQQTFEVSLITKDSWVGDPFSTSVLPDFKTIKGKLYNNEEQENSYSSSKLNKQVMDEYKDEQKSTIPAKPILRRKHFH